MALTHWGFIYTAPGARPEGDVTVVDTGSCRAVFAGVAEPGDAVAVARRLVDDGAQLIEVCGGFGPLWTARVVEAVGDRAPVGAVGYGPEAVDQLHAIFATR